MATTSSVSLSLRLLSGAAALAFVTIAAGCDDTSEERGSQPAPTFRSLADNGWQMNSAKFNGWQMNGWQMNGWQMNAVVLDGSSFTGTKIVDGEEVPMAGLDFIGTEIQLGNDERTVTMRIDDIYPSRPGSDVYFYDISVFDPGTDTWSSLCRDGEDQPTSAIPLAGAWDMVTGARRNAPDAVTLACRGAALAKCVEWGYAPWATASACDGDGENCTQVSLADHHQACTRMVRADYCGDGTPHTLNGTPIDVIDRLAPQIQAEGTMARMTWDVEAEWGPDGARCVGSSLRLQMFDDLEIPYAIPTCLDALDDHNDCGSMAADRGAKLFNKFCTAWTSDSAGCGSVKE
ncbi:MAG: hypothetical protein H0T76_13665 [Nannocystis sp.]|nr:ADYC domain-containing protein [Nannocystis sp.]MBA3547526.1 hypothetical protein [Nannocystis sp.]